MQGRSRHLLSGRRRRQRRRLLEARPFNLAPDGVQQLPLKLRNRPLLPLLPPSAPMRNQLLQCSPSVAVVQASQQKAQPNQRALHLV